MENDSGQKKQRQLSDSEDKKNEANKKQKKNGIAMEEDVDLDEILKLVDEAPEMREVDKYTLKQSMLRLTRAVNLNVQMRVKFSTNPSRFMDSELSLHMSIKALSPLTTAPDLYRLFASLGAAPTLLTLIPHENTDISIAVVNLLNELLDATNLDDGMEDGAMDLVDSLLENNMVSVLVTNLARMNEKNQDDAQAVYNTLSIFENLVEVRPKLIVTICEQANHNVLHFLFQRLRKEPFDDVRLFASEILSIFVQSGGDSVRKMAGKLGGITKLMKALAQYHKRDPNSEDEKEFAENCFNALGFIIHENIDHQVMFGKDDGLRLMITMIRKKRYVKRGALRTIDLALARCQVNCEKFIDISGLKTLFALFMQSSSGKHGKYWLETDEHVISIMSQLFFNLSDIRYLRLLRKFQEHEYAKVERLIELLDKYMRKCEEAKKLMKKENIIGDDADAGLSKDEEVMMRLMDSGLFTLQLISLVVGFVATAGDRKIRSRVVQLLAQYDNDTLNIKDILRDYSAQLGNRKFSQKNENYNQFYHENALIFCFI